AGQQAVFTPHNRNVAGHCDVDIGREVLQVGGVRHDDRPRAQDPGPTVQRRPAGMHAYDVVGVVPERLDPADVARLRRGVDRGVDLGDVVSVSHVWFLAAATAAATRTASAFGCTTCTRTPHTPAAAASAVTATVASSRWSLGRGAPGPPSNDPRNDLRLA